MEYLHSKEKTGILSLFVYYTLICSTLTKGQQSTYVLENRPGCVNNTATSWNIPQDFTIFLTFTTSTTVCTIAGIPGADPYIAITIDYIGRISCGVDVVQKYTYICFTTTVKVSDAGVYTARLVADSTTFNNTLFVMRPPTKSVISLQGNLINQRQHNLTCTAASTSVPSTGLPVAYTWTVDGAAITDPRFVVTGSSNSVLMINKVQKQDNGKRIQCTATEEKGVSSDASNETTLDVMYVPEVSVSPSNLVVILGDNNVQFTCTVVDTNPPIQSFRWTKGGNQISTTQTYTITTVQKSDNGTYQCTASNSVGSSQPASVDVDVQFPPSVSPLIKQVIIEERDLLVTCSVTAGNPTSYTVYWTMVNNPEFKQNGGTLRLDSIERQRSGTYTCTAENIYYNGRKGTTSQSMDVDVLYQPSIEEKPRVLVNESRRVTLTRRVFSNPLSNVYWYSGRELLHTQMSVETAELILRHALCTDTKNFTIVASNGIQNNATSVVELLVNCKPYPGSNNITLGITDTSGIEFSTTITAYPQPQYKLKYENGTENRKMTDILSQNAVNNFTLRFNQTTVHQSDYGVYHLEVRNSFGMSTTFVNVIPQRKPNSPTEIEVTCEENQVKVQWKSSFNGGANQSFTAFALNGEQEAGRSVLVTDTGMDNIHTVFVRNLQPSTSYVFYVSAKNIHGEKSSTTASCTTLKAPAEDTSNVEAIAGGAAAGGIGLAVIVIVIVIFVRRYSEHGKQTSKNHRLTDNGEENESQDGDGLKVNALYVSADIVNDEKPGPSETAVYAEVNKRGPESDSNANVYAEVKETGKKAGEDKVTNGAVKPKKGVFKKEEKPKQKKGKKQKLAQEMPDVYENSEDIAMKQRGDDVYSNTGENRPPKQEQRGYKNQDGLLYVEVQFEAKADTGKSVIYGEEEKTDYATVEFPFPPSSQKTAQGEKKEK